MGAAAVTPETGEFLFLRRQSGEPALEAGNRGMGRETQNSRAQFLLEAVHDGQHTISTATPSARPNMAMPRSTRRTLAVEPARRYRQS